MLNPSPELIGLAGGALTSMSLVPQALQVYRTRSVKDLSLPFMVLNTAGLVLWLAYGLVQALWSIILWNSLTIGLMGALLYAKLRFGVRRARLEVCKQVSAPDAGPRL